jgi:peptide deformylase
MTASITKRGRKIERKWNAFDASPRIAYVTRGFLVQAVSMALRNLVFFPDPQLRVLSKPIAGIDKSVQALADDMLETMYEAPGIGLAAIQIGDPRRLLVIDLAKKDEPKQPMVFINPEILSSSEEKSTYEEGCLSIPEFYDKVERPAAVRIRFMNLKGQTEEIDADGLLATCLQHEIDHLDGKLFIDYLSKLKRDRVTKKFTKIAKREG